MDFDLPHESAMALGFSAMEPVTSLPSIAHLFGSAKKRCGIYLLAFEPGLLYIGQAVDVVRRYSQHRRNHDDIVGFAFIPLSKLELDAKEKALIYQAEAQGLKITNAVHVTSIVGDTDLDLVISPQEQEAWLKDTSYFSQPESQAAKITLSEAQQVRFSKHFARLQKHPLVGTVLPLLKRYVGQCVPAPYLTEYSFWSVSCMPSTNQGTWPRLLSINAGVMELFVAGWLKQEPDELWGFMTVAEDILLNHWDSVDALVAAYPFVEAERRDYRDAGQHQITLHVIGADAMMTLLADESVTKAAGALALRVMRKRATIYSKFHCPELAGAILA